MWISFQRIYKGILQKVEHVCAYRLEPADLAAEQRSCLLPACETSSESHQVSSEPGCAVSMQQRLSVHGCQMYNSRNSSARPDAARQRAGRQERRPRPRVGALGRVVAGAACRARRRHGVARRGSSPLLSTRVLLTQTAMLPGHKKGDCCSAHGQWSKLRDQERWPELCAAQAHGS